MNKQPLKTFNFIIPYVIYPFDVMVSVNETDEQVISGMKRYGIGKEDLKECLNLPETNRGRTLLLPSNQTIIRIKDAPDTDIHSTIAHEVFHAVTFLFWRLKLKLKVTKTDEPYAYAIGYLTKEIYKNLKSK